MKISKKQKTNLFFGSIGIATVALIILGFLFLKPKGEDLLSSKFPDYSPVKSAVQSAYPQYKQVGIHYNVSYVSGSDEKITTFSLIVKSNETLTMKQMSDLGVLVCKTLKNQEREYDYVGIISQTPLLPIPLPNFNKNYIESYPCEKWIVNS